MVSILLAIITEEQSPEVILVMVIVLFPAEVNPVYTKEPMPAVVTVMVASAWSTP